MLCSSPASLLEGGEGAGGVLGILAAKEVQLEVLSGFIGSRTITFIETTKSFILYPLSFILHPSSPLRLDAECTIPPPAPSFSLFFSTIPDKSGCKHRDKRGEAGEFGLRTLSMFYVQRFAFSREEGGVVSGEQRGDFGIDTGMVGVEPRNLIGGHEREID